MCSISAYLSVCNGPLPISPHKHYMDVHFWPPPASNPFFHMWPDTVQDLPVYILKGGGWGCRLGRWCCWIGGAGYGAKWKHVTQGPLKRNPAQQKRETHIIIKSSQGKEKNPNIIPAPPSHTHTRTPTPNTHTVTYPIFPLQITEKMRWLELRCVCSLPQNDKKMFRNFLIMERLVCFQEQTWSYSNKWSLFLKDQRASLMNLLSLMINPVFII